MLLQSNPNFKIFLVTGNPSFLICFCWCCNLNLILPPVKVYGPYSLSKDALREEETPWLIKCPGKGNFSDVRHFNTPPHVWQLMAKHVDNNRRERPIITRNLWLWYYVKVHGPYSLSKDALREEGTLWLIKCSDEENFSDVGHFNTPELKYLFVIGLM
jgi:hypothetical protein